MTLAPQPVDPPARRAITLEDEDVAKRRALLARMRDDRKDLVRVAGVARDLAETFEVAQNSLAILRKSLRWLALVGGIAALTVSMRTRRRPPALLLTGLSLYLVQRWLSHPVRHELATATHPVVVGRSVSSSIAAGRIAPSPPSSS